MMRDADVVRFMMTHGMIRGGIRMACKNKIDRIKENLEDALRHLGNAQYNVGRLTEDSMVFYNAMAQLNRTKELLEALRMNLEVFEE